MLTITGKLSWPSNLLFLAGVCRSRAFRHPVGRKSHESFVLSGWGCKCQPYIESVTALSDREGTLKKANKLSEKMKNVPPDDFEISNFSASA